jgi:hypothetical protein
MVPFQENERDLSSFHNPDIISGIQIASGQYVLVTDFSGVKEMYFEVDDSI